MICRIKNSSNTISNCDSGEYRPHRAIINLAPEFFASGGFYHPSGYIDPCEFYLPDASKLFHSPDRKQGRGYLPVLSV